MNIITELKRRNVFRVGLAYIVIAWLVLQVTDVVINNIGAPDWVFQTIMLVLALGLPLVLFFAWAFEVTPDGVKRESEVDRSKSITTTTGRKLDRSIIALLVVALMYFFWESRFSDNPSSSEPANANPQSTSVQAQTNSEAQSPLGREKRSIAVLPFENFTDDKSDQYFADGLADTLLHKLAQISELRVIARNSSFQFKGTNRDIREIGQILGVETVLEGSVQRAGNQVRIIAQLINAEDGVHIWSQSFDDSMDNIFTLQDRIAAEIVDQFAISLSNEEQDRLLRRGTDNPEAYDLLMQASNIDYDMDSRTDADADTWEPLQLTLKAVELDPEYAEAWAHLSRSYNSLAFATDSVDKFNDYVKKARSAAEESLRLDPENARGQLALGWVEHRSDNSIKAIQHFRRVLELNPNSSGAMSGLGLQLAGTDPEEALQLFNRSHEIDPSATFTYRQKHFALVMLGRVDEAIEQLELAIQADPREGVFYNDLADLLVGTQGRPDEAARQVSRLLRLSPRSFTGVMAMVEAWTAAGEHDRASAWMAILMKGRSDSDEAKLRNARRLISASRYNEALKQLNDVKENDDNAWQLLVVRVSSAIGLKDLNAANKHISDYHAVLTDMKNRSGSNPMWNTYSAVFSLLVQEMPGSELGAKDTLGSIPPLEQIPFFKNSFYLHAGMQARLGNQQKAMDWLEQALARPDGGVFNIDKLGFDVEQSPLLNPLRGEPAFESWLQRYRERRDTMLQRMIALELQGEIIEAAATERLADQ